MLFDDLQKVRAVVLQLIIADAVDLYHVLLGHGHLFGKFLQCRISESEVWQMVYE